MATWPFLTGSVTEFIDGAVAGLLLILEKYQNHTGRTINHEDINNNLHQIHTLLGPKHNSLHWTAFKPKATHTYCGHQTPVRHKSIPRRSHRHIGLWFLATHSAGRQSDFNSAPGTWTLRSHGPGTGLYHRAQSLFRRWRRPRNYPEQTRHRPCFSQYCLDSTNYKRVHHLAFNLYDSPPPWHSSTKNPS